MNHPPLQIQDQPSIPAANSHSCLVYPTTPLSPSSTYGLQVLFSLLYTVPHPPTHPPTNHKYYSQYSPIILSSLYCSSPTHSPTHQPAHSLTHPLTNSPTHTHPPTHPPTHPLTHPPTHSPTHSCIHLITFGNILSYFCSSFASSRLSNVIFSAASSQIPCLHPTNQKSCTRQVRISFTTSSHACRVSIVVVYCCVLCVVHAPASHYHYLLLYS